MALSPQVHHTPQPDKDQVQAGESTSQAIFAPIEPPTIFEKAIDRLGQAIALGLLAPGQQLPTERELAQQLNISRPTLRQALVALQQSGYLQSRRGRAGGTWVVDAAQLAQRAPAPLAQDWRDRLDYRLTIEVGCVVLCVDRLDAVFVNSLKKLVAEMEAADSYEQFRQSDIRFHLALAEATRSPRLIDAMADAQTAMTHMFAHMVVRPPVVWKASNIQHAELVEALVRRDQAEAVRITCAHVESSRHILAGLTTKAHAGKTRAGSVAARLPSPQRRAD